MVRIKELIFGNQLFLSALVALILFLATLVAGKAIWQQKTEISDKKEALSKLKADLDVLDSLLASQKANAEKMQLIAQTLPATYEEVALSMEALEKTAQTSDQKIEAKIDENSNKEPNDLNSLKITIKTAGGYESLTKMLSGFSSLRYHTKIDTLKIEGEGQELITQTTLRLYLRRTQ